MAPSVLRAFAALFALATAAGIALAAATSAAAATAPRFTVSAHRGGLDVWPENSLAAFTVALARGYDEIEADAWILRDGNRVIYHDATISPTRCGGRYAGQAIRALTLAQVATVRCQGQPIPTVGALLSLIARSHNKHTVLRLETKGYPGQTAAQARSWAQRIGADVVAYKLTGRAILQDFDWNGIAGYHAASRALRVSALTVAVTPDLVAQAQRLGAYDISYDAPYATAEINADIVAHHLVPTVWGTDSVPFSPGTPSIPAARAAQRSVRATVCSGVKVVITSYPALITNYRPQLSCD